MNWKGSRVNVSYQEKPVADVVRELFANIGVPVVISSRITGALTGKFNQPAEEFFDNLASVFGLMSYYDGSVYYVYAASEATSRVVSLKGTTPERFRQSLRQMGVGDRRYELRVNDAEKMASVSGPPRFVDSIEEVANILQERQRNQPSVMSDAGASTRRSPARAMNASFRVYPLRFAWAQDTTMAVGGREVVVPGVASTLRRLVGNYSRGSEAAGGAVAGAAGSNPNMLRGLRGQGLAAQGGSMRAPFGASPADLARDAGPEGLNAFPPGYQGGDSGIDASGSMVNVSLPRVEADARTNSVIVHDVPGRISRYDELIAALDVKTAIVQIEATIIDVSTDSVDKLGVDWSRSSTNLVFGRGSNGADGAFRQGAVDMSTNIANGVVNSAAGVGFAAASGGAAVPIQGLTTVVGNMGRYFLAQVNLLAQQGKAFVHSRPSVMTMNNLEAVLENTQTFYVRVAGERQVDLFNITSGTILRVTPAVVDEGGQRRVKLAVRIKDGSLTGQTVDQIPIVKRSTVGSHAMVGEGQSLLVGGYAYDLSSDLDNRVPLLGDIPALGALFRFKNRQVSRVERMFMITPRVVEL